VTPLRVLLASPGLGRQARGAEIFSADCCAALRDDLRLDLVLARGGGERREGELRIPNVPRDSSWGIRLGTRLGGDGYTGEVWSFALGLLPHLVRLRPRVVYVTELLLARVLRRWRTATRSRFRLLLWNGAPYRPPFPDADFVQQLTPERVELALAAGERPERQAFVPPGFFLAGRRVPLDAESKRALRRRLGLPEEKPVVLSVGVLDPVHKGQDRLIRACAQCKRANFLLLLGGRADTTASLEELARAVLGPRVAVRSTEPSNVADYYAAADVFALASLREGFGLVFVEAAAHGLPCIVDGGSGAREVLGEWGTYVDTLDHAAFTKALDAALASSPAPDAAARHDAMVARYDWANLRESYVAMLRAAAAVSIR
jgi:glycosyltransferase involved in cell wall biosynthesis